MVLLSMDSGEGCGANAMMGTKRELEGQQDGSKGKGACCPSLAAWFNAQDVGLRALPPQQLSSNSHTHGTCAHALTCPDHTRGYDEFNYRKLDAVLHTCNPSTLAKQQERCCSKRGRGEDWLQKGSLLTSTHTRTLVSCSAPP